VADVESQWALDYQRLIVTPGNENFCAFLPMYGERNYRVLGTLPKNFSKNESINFSQIQGVIANTLGIPVEFHLVNWFSTYKLHHRMADSFRKGCVFLAGDSAHIHSPAGGQGMNTGLQDAYNLAWKLSMVIKKQATEKLLDTYNEERLPFARWLLKFTDRGFKVMTNNSNWLLKFFRQNIAVNIAGLVLSSGFIRPLAFKIISQIGYSYKRRSLSASKSRQKLKFSAGDRLPYFTDDNIYGKFTRPGFHLLHIHDHPLTGDEVNSINKLYNFPVFIVEDIESTKWQKLGLKRELFVLVRPDNYISYICDHLDQLASDPARQLFSN